VQLAFPRPLFTACFDPMTRRTTFFSFSLVLSIASWMATPCFATRFIAFAPQSATAPPVLSADSPATALVAVAPGSAAGDRQWSEYLDAWREHARNPADAKTRQRLGLPEQSPVHTIVGDGQSLARTVAKSLSIDWVGPQSIETEHFIVLADVPSEVAAELAIELEQFHAVWTQLFFPLWKDRQRWNQAGIRTPRLPAQTRGVAANKMRVIVLRDRNQYQIALKSEGPQIGQSTGYYSGSLRTTFLLASARGDQSASALDESRATRFHELTHQLLAEATDTKLKTMPGERSGFWLAEGIACYMESTRIDDGVATVGGWESSRLQFARHRALNLGETTSIDLMRNFGRMQFQRHVDLPSIYALAAAESHRIIDQNDGDGLNEMISQLAKLYQIRRPASQSQGQHRNEAAETDLITYLTLNDRSLTPLVRDDLINLCLARCDLSPATLSRITPQRNLVWLDLTALKVSADDVMRLCPQPASLKQLSLEATLIDDSIANWIADASAIEELDLSWTGIGDSTLSAISADASLQTLWLTGSRISDASIDRIAAWRSLRRVDLQRTEVTDAGRASLARLRPDLKIDPLELVSTQ